MTATNLTFGAAHAVGERVKAIFASVLDHMVVYAERNSRMAHVNALEAMTDDELAALGIKRDGIVQHVFRDVLYI
ncbi:DUF1127 domain-containing protein [Loktanella sp. TSTF-M6]|uniref:DUF1127 domain-containing protein n=1 Tax=Loktanella gaetbuli TaxID=2881335 RepID=A0ABS8BTD4_9RHOB|nr:DUF1127 domain-containing protein [Loktanella gaetbuli]MCB5198990.1 DUF1127 domain-containing protein [Loktanella gaetbuli]